MDIWYIGISYLYTMDMFIDCNLIHIITTDWILFSIMFELHLIKQWNSYTKASNHLTISNYHFLFIEGSLEVKLPTIWTDEKQSRAEAERRERLEERRVEEKESEERRCRCAKR